VVGFSQRWVNRVGLAIAILAAAGCGAPSADEWQGAQRHIAKLKADLDAADRRHADDERNYAEAEQQIESLKAKLLALGTALRSDPVRQPDATPGQPQAPILPSGWVPLGTSEDHRCLVDLSVEIDPSQNRAALGVSTFFKAVYRSKTLCPNQPFKEFVVNDYVNCAKRAITHCEEIRHGWDGVPRTDPGCGREQTVFPDTFDEVLWKYVCGQR
jgi:hypothetical protein